MPRGDGTGPRGQGSGIGRGMGQRGGSRGAGFGVGPGILQYPQTLGQLTGGLNPGSISGVKYLPMDPGYSGISQIVSLVIHYKQIWEGCYEGGHVL